jgi:A/G-specific adenine glycosylase
VAAEGRSFLWRLDRDPYLVLVAEVLLRQTRASSVPPVLGRFLDRFPTLEALARADPPDVLAVVHVLGFGQQRTAQLQRLAAELVTGNGSTVPPEVASLQSLPGIGRYSAAMIAASCFGADVPAVDTNVARVLCRVFDIQPSHAEARKSTNVWTAATLLTSARPGAAAELTWGMVDLADAICKPKAPLCARCPLQRWCGYAAHNGDA